MIVAVLATMLNDGSDFFTIGPNDKLVLVSTKINTPQRYVGMIFVLILINGMTMIVEELGMPVLGFNVYNPDKTHIVDFTKNELNFLANGMFVTSALRSSLMLVVSISQIDVAIISVIIKEIASFFVVRHLLNEKTFGENIPIPDEEVEIVVVN